MLILLPPSESKAARSRGAAMTWDRLSFPALTTERQQVANALTDVSSRPDAADQLGVSRGLADETTRNTRLGAAPAVKASRLYTGVLYDALDYASLEPAARRRANRWLLVASALYGALRPTDAVAPYRLSMGVNLPGIGPLAPFWRGPLSQVLPEVAGRGVIVDCRSSTYAAAWAPQGALASRWVQVRVPGATHMAKHTRGLVARHLCAAGSDVRTPQALTDVVSHAFDTALHEPTRPGRPWTLDVTVRGDDGSAGASCA